MTVVFFNMTGSLGKGWFRWTFPGHPQPERGHQKTERRYQKPERGHQKNGAMGQKAGTRSHSPEPPFYKTALLFPLESSCRAHMWQQTPILKTPNILGVQSSAFSLLIKTGFLWFFFSEQLPCRSAEVNYFSIFLCQRCREIWREIMVKFSVLCLPGFGCARENFTKISRQKRCEKRKISRKFHSAGAQRWVFGPPPKIA